MSRLKAITDISWLILLKERNENQKKEEGQTLYFICQPSHDKHNLNSQFNAFILIHLLY